MIVTRRGVLALLGLGAVLAATPYLWNRRWRYITIHHSGGDHGNVALLQRVHRERQPRDPVDAIPYHFLIGNGNGLGLGEVVETWRWRFGIWGAHLSARNTRRNFRGIGICLIGDFQTGEVPETQLSAAITLTQKLMRRLHIPPENVTLHGSTPREATLCPGKKFPKDRFMSASADRELSDDGLAG
jgi:hypothetical protein